MINIIVNKFRELLEMTCRIANVLKDHNVSQGERVIIYMPAMPLAVASMLACARIGAVHRYLHPCSHYNHIPYLSCEKVLNLRYYTLIYCALFSTCTLENVDCACISFYSVIFAALSAKDVKIRIKNGIVYMCMQLTL